MEIINLPLNFEQCYVPHTVLYQTSQKPRLLRKTGRSISSKKHIDLQSRKEEMIKRTPSASSASIVKTERSLLKHHYWEVQKQLYFIFPCSTFQLNFFKSLFRFTCLTDVSDFCRNLTKILRYNTYPTSVAVQQNFNQFSFQKDLKIFFWGSKACQFEVFSLSL